MDIVKENKDSGKAKLSLTPWLSSGCNPHPEASWSERSVHDRVWLHHDRREGKKENKNKRRLLSKKACKWWQSICFTQLPTHSWIFVSQMIHSHFRFSHTLESSPKSIMTWGPCCPLIGQSNEEFNALNHWSFFEDILNHLLPLLFLRNVSVQVLACLLHQTKCV